MADLQLSLQAIQQMELALTTTNQLLIDLDLGVTVGGYVVSDAYIEDGNLMFILSDGSEVLIGKVQGDAFTYADFTPEQLALLKGDKGDAFVYEDFTPQQILDLKGQDGYTPIKGVDYFDGEDGATYIHPTNHPPSIISQDMGNRFVTDTQIAYWNAKRDQIPNDELARVIESDFYDASVNAVMNILGVAISSGTVGGINSEINHPGVIYIRDSTTANGGYRYMTAPTAFLLAGGEFCQFVFKPVSIRATSSFRFGFQDSTAINTAPTDGVWLEVVPNGTNPILTGKANNNTGAVSTGTTYTLTANTWYACTIQLNANATLATFTLYSENDTQLWQETLSTKLPTGAGRQTGWGIIAGETTTDAAADILHLDYISMGINRTLTR